MNTNALEGVRCPVCGSEEKFAISAMVIIEITDDGIQDYRNVDWEDTANCWCHECGHHGDYRDFKEKNEDEEDEPE